MVRKHFGLCGLSGGGGAGNVACDEAGGGRLIFYDFGMMDEFKPSVRSGLVNLIFSTYENDPRAVCNALVEMGILRANADRIRYIWFLLFYAECFVFFFVFFCMCLYFGVCVCSFSRMRDMLSSCVELRVGTVFRTLAR